MDRFSSLMTCGLAVACLFVSALVAEDSTSEGPTAAPAEERTVDSEGVAERQGIVINRVQQLEDRMFQLSRILSKTEPEQAARLMEALSTGRQMLIRQRLERIVTDLKVKRFSDASEEQEKILGDLQRLLLLLLDEHKSPTDKDHDMEELRALRQQLNRIIEEQEAEYRAAQETRDSEQALGDLQQAIDKLKGLLEKQSDLSRSTQQRADVEDASREPTDSLESEQRQLRQETQALARQLDETPAKADSARSDDAPDSESAENKDATSGAAQSLDSASKAMQQAEEALSRGSPSAARSDQQEAEEQLREALEQLEKKKEELEARRDYLKQADEQRQTAERTEELARKMSGKPSGESSGGEDGGEGQEGSPSEGDQSKPEAPGADQVQQAVPHQRQAADKLGEQDAEGASRSQEEALEKLREARQELEELLEQMRREQQEEMLAALEVRFSAMLERQLEVNRRTDRLEGVGRTNWSRADQLELVETSQGQGWVADQADEALKILQEDGTTVVFPQIVEQVRDDARHVAARLAEADTGSTVRQTQEEIVATLQELLDAIKQMEQKMNEEGGQGMAGQPDQPPPLLPGSAELKLLRSSQVRVNRMTVEIEQQRILPEMLPEGLEDRLNQLWQRQSKVADMASDMLEAGGP